MQKAAAKHAGVTSAKNGSRPRRASPLTKNLRRELKLQDGRLRAREQLPVYQYPAMMVSPMQRALLEAAVDHRGTARKVCDPFLGSGTTMVESALRGLSFVGRDINPLAILIGRVETCEGVEADVARTISQVAARARKWRGMVSAPADAWCHKWFRTDVALDLASLRAAIREEPDVRERRVMWATLAEIVRVSGNHLASRPKLQTRPADSLGRRVDVVSAFERHGVRTVRHLEEQRDSYEEAACGGPGVTFDLACGDIRSVALPDGEVDVVLTSPPYGDNHTTMPYGQASYLALRWIDTADIDDGVDTTLLQTSKSLDTASLGGSLRLDTERGAETLSRSATLASLRGAFLGAPRHAWARTLGFFSDLDDAFDRILMACTRDAHFVLTLGDKTTYGRHVPSSKITEELLAARDVVAIDRLDRHIAHKRLAPRNCFSDTIGIETVLLAQRC